MATLGIITSCLQIADTALKLKKLWSEIRNGPRDVEELVQEVVIQAEALSDLHRFHQSSSSVDMSDSGWERCYLLFKASAEALERATVEVNSMLSKHKRTGALRLYLSKDALVRCKDRFQRVQATMFTAQQAYFTLFAARNFNLILSEVRTLTDQRRQLPISVNKTCSDSRTDQIAARTKTVLPSTSHYEEIVPKHHSAIKLNRTREKWAYRLELPTWIVRKGLQIAIQRSSAHWGITLRTYNNVGYMSPVFIAARQDDWATVQKLFASRQASPFDVDPWGQTLLCEAARGFQLDACLMLMRNGLDPGESIKSDDFFGDITPVRYMAWGNCYLESSPAMISKASDTIALLARADVEAFTDSEGLLEFGFCDYPPALLAIVIRFVFPHYEAVDPLCRIRMAFGGSYFDADRLHLLLGQDIRLEQAFELAQAHNLEENHLRLLLMLSSGLGETSVEGNYNECWLSTLSAIVDFERENFTKHTYSSALLRFLQGYSWPNNRYSESGNHMGCNQIVTKIARIWLELLQRSGADLERYLVAEKMALLHQSTEVIQLRGSRGEKMVVQVQYLCGGAKIEDWNLFVVPATLTYDQAHDRHGYIEVVVGHAEYEMSGDFWDWVENPELFNIPGAYTDESDDDLDWGPCLLEGPAF